MRPDVTTDAGVDALFERIGSRVGAGVFETDAARAVQDLVAAQLRNARKAR